MSDFKAKMHQIRFRLGRGRVRTGGEGWGGGKWEGGEGEGGRGGEGKGRDGEGGEIASPPEFLTSLRLCTLNHTVYTSRLRPTNTNYRIIFNIAVRTDRLYSPPQTVVMKAYM